MAAVIGDPIAHSLSPAICNAAFDALGLDWVYVAFRVAEGSAVEAVRSMRALGIRGLSVTMPHKAAVIPSLDALDASAERLGAVNCIADADGRLLGHNTDGAGFVSALAAEGHDVAGARCVVLGAGGAARAVVLALADAGAQEVVVANRSPQRGTAAAALAEARGRAVGPGSLAVEMRRWTCWSTPRRWGCGPGTPAPWSPPCWARTWW